MKKWDPDLFVQGIVLLELQHLNVVKELSERAVRNSNATTSVAELRRAQMNQYHETKEAYVAAVANS